jgi:hypothetical protein
VPAAEAKGVIGSQAEAAKMGRHVRLHIPFDGRPDRLFPEMRMRDYPTA